MKLQDIICKSKTTQYKHKHWFSCGTKSVYDAVRYFVDSNDFSLSIIPKFRKVGAITGTDSTNYKEVLQYCIDNRLTHWKYLRISSSDSDGGSDKGKLKILTWIAYVDLKDVADFAENM